MKIVLLGPNGQLGWELRRSLAPLGQVIPLERGGAGDPRCGDLSRPDDLVSTLRALKPAVVVNAAAHTAVDKAESEPELASRVNAQAPGRIAAALAEWNGWLLHYSTDYVFDGSGDQPRDESAPTGPQSVYGRTKLEGELAIRASGCRHLILRTSWVHAARGGNFAKTMLRLAAQRAALDVVDDQIGAPTGADLLADVSAHVLRTAVTNPSVAGTYHACASGETSWWAYARHVVAWGHRVGLKLETTVERVRGIPSAAYPTPARRPLNSRLDTGKLRRTFDLQLPDWQSGVDRMLDEVRPALFLPTAP